MARNTARTFFIAAFLLVQELFAYSLLATSHPLGEMERPACGQSLGMAGVGAALINPQNLSLINPANLCAINLPSFSLSGAYEFANLIDDADNRSTFLSTNLPVAVFAYPFSVVSLFGAYHQISRLDAEYAFSSSALQGNIPVSSLQFLHWSGSRYAVQAGAARKWNHWLCTGISFERFFSYEKQTVLLDFKDTLLIYFADRKDTLALNSSGDQISLGITAARRQYTAGLSVTVPMSGDASQKTSFSILQNNTVPRLECC